MNKKVILIGPRLNTNIKSIGGTTILFELLVKALKNNEITVIETNYFQNIFLQPLNFLKLLLLLIINLNGKKANVIINTSNRLFFTFGALAAIICKVFSCPIIFRIFGGSFDMYLNKKNFNFYVLKFIIENSKYIVFETEYLINLYQNEFKYSKDKFIYFPNSRSKPQLGKQKKQKNFVYVGHVNVSKGIKMIINHNKKVSQDRKIDVFGPAEGTALIKDLGSNYKGVLKHEEVQETLENYKFLVFPSQWHSEGIPGIAIEALSLGIPVLASNFRSIPEIVKDKVTGFLFNPGDQSDFEKKLQKSLNIENYNDMRKNCKDIFNKNFEEKLIHSNFVKAIEINIAKQ